jgi:hypothetical protein
MIELHRLDHMRTSVRSMRCRIVNPSLSMTQPAEICSNSDCYSWLGWGGTPCQKTLHFVKLANAYYTPRAHPQRTQFLGQHHSREETCSLHDIANLWRNLRKSASLPPQTCQEGAVPQACQYLSCDSYTIATVIKPWHSLVMVAPIIMMVSSTGHPESSCIHHSVELQCAQDTLSKLCGCQHERCNGKRLSVRRVFGVHHQ